MTFAPHPSRPSMNDLEARVLPAIAGSSRLPGTERRVVGPVRQLRIPFGVTGHIRSGLSETVQDLRSFALTQIVKDAVEPHCMEQRRGIADILDGCIRTAADVRPSEVSRRSKK